MEHAHLTRTAAVLAAAVLAAGCGTDAPQSSSGSSAPQRPSVATMAPADLNFTAKTVTGETFDARRLVGKPTVLWFWAPWCPTCRAQEPTVTALAKGYAGRVTFVGVGGLDDAEAIVEHGTELRAFPQLNDERGEIWKRFGVTAQSWYVVIDADGRVLGKGYLDNDELTRRVAELAG